MSKVYEYHLEMEELFADADYNEWLNQQQELTVEDIFNYQKTRIVPKEIED